MKKKLYIALFTLSACLQAEPLLKKRYNFSIPEKDFEQIALDATNGIKLPMDKYPATGKYRAFRLLPAKGKFAGKPIDILIRTEHTEDDLENDLAESAATDTSAIGKTVKTKMAQHAKKIKENGPGLHAIYRAVKKPSGTFYKLLQLRVPGTEDTGEIDDDAVIVATPTGNLQFFEESTEKPGTKDVSEISTDDAD